MKNKKVTLPELDAMSMKPAHTPTPWKVWNDRIWTDAPSDEMIGIATITGNRSERDADAAFIVKACNSHNELVSALKDLIAYVVDARIGGAPVVDNARQALATAEGKAL